MRRKERVMRNRVLLGIVCILVAICIGQVSVADAPAPASPKSAKARQAMREYDRVLRDAERAFEKVKSDADAQRRRALQVALDDALRSKDLDEANRIKALMGEPRPETANKDVSLIGSKWHRFGIGDHGECSIVFLPGGRLEAVKTGWTNWKQDGDALVLLKGNEVSARFMARRDVAVFFTDGALSAKDSLILVPSSFQKGEPQR
jgi:hypothetical protein